MTVDWTDELLDQLEFHWTHQLRPRLEGLDDDEYLWQPVDGCWTVRDDGDGGVVPDGAAGEPDPPPFTTIAWRLCHIGGPVLGMRVANHFGDGDWAMGEVDWPATADAALAFVDDTHRAWRDGVAGLSRDQLAEPCGPAEGPFADRTMAALVLHINREVIHHGAEVACIRDLYAHR